MMSNMPLYVKCYGTMLVNKIWVFSLRQPIFPPPSLAVSELVLYRYHLLAFLLFLANN